MKTATLFAAALFLLSTPAFAQSPITDLSSPDGRVAIHFETSLDKPAATQPSRIEKLAYSITFNNQPLLTRSTLQLNLKDQPPLGPGLQIVSSETSTHDSTYHLLAGKASTVRDHYNALILHLEEPAAPQSAGRKLDIEARAYDDGRADAIAFRYVVPEQPALHSFQLASEHTQFQIVKDALAYALVLPNFVSMYESEYIPLHLSALANQGGIASHVLLGCPCLLDVPHPGGDLWLNITEADLQGNAAMYLTNPAASWTGHYLESKLSPRLDDPSIAVDGPLPHHSAWRVVQVATAPGQLIESTVLTSLNPESQLADTSWIHPGKASWNWWSGSIGPDGKSDFSTDLMKYYVDFASQSGLEYMLIDAGWAQPIDPKNRHSDITQMNGRVNIPDVVQYAKARNVKVWIWLSYIDTARQMTEAFPLYEQWGVAGCKIDFVERNDQAGIQWYCDVAKLAAQHHLLLDFHGCTTPTGMERSFPNILGYEAVAGMEQSKAGMRDNPTHHVTLPFTRMLAGPMDYTPGSFHNTTRELFEPVMDRPMTIGTRAHQLAMYPVYFAPIQMVSDNPAAYANAPEFDFIKQCPSAWDETRAIDGRPGQFITVARRKGSDWFLGAMTNDDPRQLQIPLSFLPAGTFTATIYADAPDAATNPTHVAISHQSVTSATILTASLAPAGGYAVRISP